MRFSRLVRAFALTSWLALLVTARAHDPGLSVADAEVRETTIELTTSFAPADVTTLLPTNARTGGKWTLESFTAAQQALLQLAETMWEVHSGSEVLRFLGEPSVELTEQSDSVNFRLTFPRPSTGGTLVFRARKLEFLPPGHREYFTGKDKRGLIVEKLLHAKSPTVDMVVPTLAMANAAAEARPHELPSFWGFLELGVKHIWTGYDHLLFLFGLLVVCRTFKSIVAIITCFTLAHSLTLALATLNVVNIPSRFVEPMIAASIVFVGMENLVRRGAEPKGRWALTFAFGLIHGFGFASVLRELGVGQGGRGLLMPLFTFNVGVEVGQVAVAAVVLPIVWHLRKNETFLRRGVPALSAIVALAGLYWLLERTVFASA